MQKTKGYTATFTTSSSLLTLKVVLVVLVMHQCCKPFMCCCILHVIYIFVNTLCVALERVLQGPPSSDWSVQASWL